MIHKTAFLVAGLVLALIVAMVVGASSTSAATTTKGLSFSGSGTDQPFSVKVHCDACVPDLFVDGVGQLAITVHANTFADLTGDANLTIDTPEEGALLNQGSVIPLPMTLQGTGGNLKISADIKGSVEVQQNVPEPGQQGERLFGFNLTSPRFTLLDKGLSPLHNGQQASLTDSLKSPTLIDPCELAGLSVGFDKGIGEIGIGLKCPITIAFQTTANLAGNGITADRAVEVKGVGVVSGTTIDFPKGEFIDNFEIPCDAPASSFINLTLANKRYGATVDASGKVLLQGQLQAGVDLGPLGFFDLLEFLGIDATVRINLNDLFGIPDFDVFDGKVVANATGEPKETVSLGQVSKDKEQPVVKSIVAAGTFGEGKPLTFTATANDNCGGALHYKWSFSDGGVAFGSTVQHAFADNGVFSASVRVTDLAGNEGRLDIFGLNIANRAPVVLNVVADPNTVPWGVPVTLSVKATDQSAVDNAKLSFKWDFGDGQSALGQTATHSYSTPGAKTATVTVSDDKTSTSAQVQVLVNPRDTNIKYEGPIKREANDPNRAIEAVGVLLDHQGDPVKGRTLQFRLINEAGEAIEQVNAVTDGNGRARALLTPPEAPPNTDVTYFVRIDFKGDNLYNPSNYAQQFTDHGSVSPVVSPLPSGIKTPWGVPVEFSGFATDPDGSAQDTLKYVWDFGDGTPVQINQKVTHAFAPTTNGPYTATVRLTVTDKDGASTTVETRVQVNKRPTTIKNCGPTQVLAAANKVALCGNLVVADIDGGDADAGIKDKVLQFGITDARNKQVVGTTDGNGNARPTLSIVLANGCYPARIEFKGDNLYDPSRLNYVFYTTGGGRITGPVVQCSLSVSAAGFQLLDSDGDGCSNGEEAGTNARLGGSRDPKDPYDFFDTPTPAGGGVWVRDQVVTLADVLQVALRFRATGDPSGALFLGPVPNAPAYHPAYDRSYDGGVGPADGAIGVQDVLLVASQWSNSCA